MPAAAINQALDRAVAILAIAVLAGCSSAHSTKTAPSPTPQQARSLTPTEQKYVNLLRGQGGEPRSIFVEVPWEDDQTLVAEGHAICADLAAVPSGESWEQWSAEHGEGYTVEAREPQYPRDQINWQINVAADVLCTVHVTGRPSAAPAQPLPGSAMPPSTAPPRAPDTGRQIPADADSQGFLGYPGARCNYTNPAVVIARTADSALSICQTGAGRYYYRGVGLGSGLSVEIDDPVRTATGFVAMNNGVRYSVSPGALIIIQGSNVLSNEPMLEYWAA